MEKPTAVHSTTYGLRCLNTFQ